MQASLLQKLVGISIGRLAIRFTWLVFKVLNLRSVAVCAADEVQWAIAVSCVGVSLKRKLSARRRSNGAKGWNL